MTSRIVFMGSPAFAVPALAALVHAADVEVVGVVSQPDRPAGRGRKLRPPPVKAYAVEQGLLITQPRKVRNGDLQRWLAERNADVAIVAAYGRILPQAVLDTPRLGCLNLHASLLPRWRGASPIQRAIAAGDAASGVCLMQMDAGLDTGAVLARIETPITTEDTAESLSERLSTDGATLLVRSLPALFSGQLTAVVQPEEGITYAPLLTKQEGKVPWHLDAERVHAHIRGMTSWPGAWSTLVQSPAETWKVFPPGMRVVESEPAAPGTLIRIKAERVTIACGDGALELHELQRPGRKRMGAGSAVRGARLQVGAQFSAVVDSSASCVQ